MWAGTKCWACRLVAGLSISIGIAFSADAPVVTGVHNFHEVDPHVYRGAQPTAEGLRSLAKLGIKTIIDLREGGTHSEAEKRAVEALGMRYVSVPMRGFSAPSNDQIARVLAILESSGSSDWPVFVHCRRGADRTGTAIACYRIDHDHWPGQKALSEARLHGMSWIERAMQEYILKFKPAAPQVSSASIEKSVPASQ